MPLDPQARAILDLIAASDTPDLSIVEPAVIRKLTNAAVVPGQGEPVARVENRTLPGTAGEIPVRIYVPQTNGPLPVVAYFHGGGFVYCGLDTHDGTCRALANASGCSVVSVDYRLAPENKFPAAPEDAFDVTCWLATARGPGSRRRIAPRSCGHGGRPPAPPFSPGRRRLDPHLPGSGPRGGR